MIIFIVVILCHLCGVLSSPALRRAASSAATPTSGSSSTTKSAPATLSTFWWSNSANVTDGGYYPAYDQCPGLGTTCEEACGLGAVVCGDIVVCYFPGLGDQCCSKSSGMSCWRDTMCADTDTDDTQFCCYDDETEEECASLAGVALHLVTPLPDPTSSPQSTGSSLIDRTTVWKTKDHYITVTASISNSVAIPTPTLTPTPTSASNLTGDFDGQLPSSSSAMTVGAKIGVGIGVPTAVLALGILGIFTWLRVFKQGRLRQPQRVPPLEVDAQESQLTPGEYERRKNQKPPEDGQDDANFESAAEGSGAAPRSSYLQVSPLSTNRESMAISSATSPSPYVNYTPIPVSDLPEFVEGPSK